MYTPIERLDWTVHAQNTARAEVLGVKSLKVACSSAARSSYWPKTSWSSYGEFGFSGKDSDGNKVSAQQIVIK